MKLFISLSIFSSVVTFVICADDCLVTTKLGTLRGKEDESRNGKKFCSFIGIPFAKEVQRFQEAELGNSWEGILDAQNAGPMCPQLDSSTDAVVGDEKNCLSINVYKPSEDQCPALVKENSTNGDSNNIPVFVHIHGGTFVSGSGSEYGPKYFMDACVVFVTFNYRLGALGFLTTEDGLIPGNLGLKDQRLALKWIQMNVREFGGNPESVTINGISAGSCSVSHLVASKSAQGLFHRAIAQSGSATNVWAISKNPGEKSRRLGQLLNCSQENGREQITTAALKTCLLTKSIEEVVTAQNKMGKWNIHPQLPFGPVVERLDANDPIHTVNPMHKIKNGDVNKVPSIQGFMENEGMIFSAFPLLMDKAAIKDMNDNWTYVAPLILFYDEDYIPQEKKDEFSQKIYQFYFGNKSIGVETMQNLVNLCSDRYFVQGTFKNAQYYSQYAPVYPYVFTYKGEFSSASFFGYAQPAATHADDIQYFFSDILSSWGIELGDADINYSERLIKLWMSFVEFGKPTQTWPAVESWKPYDPVAQGPWYKLDTNPQEIPSYLEERKTFWDNLGLDLYDYPIN